MGRIGSGLGLVRYFGPKWAAYKLWHVILHGSGLLEKRLPVSSWNEWSLEKILKPGIPNTKKEYSNWRSANSPRFFFSALNRKDYCSVFSLWDDKQSSVVDYAQRIKGGAFKFFEKLEFEIGFPPHWSRNAVSGTLLPKNQHWSTINDFHFGDIKLVWEPSRFAFTYTLVRAYWRTGNETFAETFWTLIEDWAANNQPNLGPNWKCGQETAIRVMAWCFGLYSFADAPSSTPQRIALLVTMIAASGVRIAGHIQYAISQRNNHAISEALGLWTIGTLFPELKYAFKWKQQGRLLLEKLARELIYSDGSFVQHSANYHRLMLHNYLWVLRLAQLNDDPFNDELRGRVEQSAEFLRQIQDNVSGSVPLYGPNDGALVLPLTNCDYRDFRPIVQVANYMFRNSKAFSSGPWDEELLWLYGREAALSSSLESRPQQHLSADEGGCYCIRSEEGFAFIRCPEFRDRPTQADALHVDIWWQGINVAQDAGTYSYNAPGSTGDMFGETRFHNTVTVDRKNQMDRVSRFIWLPWIQARMRCFKQLLPAVAYWEGEHNGYERLKAPVVCRRGVIMIGSQSWLVIDRLISSQSHSYELHWLFPNLPYHWSDQQLELRVNSKEWIIKVMSDSRTLSSSIVVGDCTTWRGLRAEYYSEFQKAISLEAITIEKSVWLFTLISAEFDKMRLEHSKLVIGRNSDGWEILLGETGESHLVRSVIPAHRKRK